MLLRILLLLRVLLLLLLLLLRVLLLRLLLLRGLRSRRRHAWSTKQMTSSTELECLRAHGVLKRLQVIQHVFRFLITLLRPAFATTHHDRGKPLRNAIIPPRIDRRRVRHQFGASKFRILCFAKNVSPRDRAIEHRAYGIKIRGRRDVARVQDLFRSHVLDRSEPHFRTREVCRFQILTRTPFDTTHAEIDDDPAHFAVRLRLHDDIAGLHVAMNDVRPMQIA